MASTTALFIGLSGLNTHSRNLDVIGNNIANVNTTAFKSTRMLFESMFYRTLSIGSEPTAQNGGSNPQQIGLGVGIGGMQRDFSDGAPLSTGDSRDLAINGSGLFIVDRDGAQFYTRDGAFRTDENSQLVNIHGDRVMGYGIDADFNIVQGSLEPISLPIGSLTIAEATENLRFAGNLNAGGDLPTQGSQIQLMGTSADALNLIASASVPPGAGNEMELNSLLVEIEDPQLPGSDTPLFVAGQIIELTGVQKGTGLLPAASFSINAATTVGELLNFFNEAIGIQTGLGPNPDGNLPGAQLDTATGVMTIYGNTGSANDIEMTGGDIRLLDASGAIVRQPFVINDLADANGESVRTTFIAFDSLGTAVEADMTMVLESKSNAGTTWRYYIESADDSDMALAVGTGTVQFDPFGQLIGPASVTAQIDRAGTGAQTPLSFEISFGDLEGGVTAFTDVESTLVAIFQDGAPIGTLTNFGIDEKGVIVGSFSNGRVRNLGQIALGSFTNPEGLVDTGAGLYTVGPNSGEVVTTAPGTLGTGRIVSGALEQSNVDLGTEFINLIRTSTGYSASSRIIRTTDELLQQLLVLGR